MCKESKKETKGETENASESVSTFEDVLALVGLDTKWHYFILFCCVWASVVSPLHTVSYQFLGAAPKHWCRIGPLMDANWTLEQINNISLPNKDESGKKQYCAKKNYNYEALAKLGYDEAYSDKDKYLNTTTPEVECLERYFDPMADPTISTDWDLVCDRKWIYSFTQTAVMIGKLVGSFALGYLFDLFGRKKILCWSSPIYILVGLVTAASPNVWMYVVCKVISSALGMAFYMGGLVLALEMSSPKQRSYVGPFSALPWSVGYMLTAIIAYLVRPWKWLQVAITLPALTQAAALWMIPESPRWLMMKGRYDESNMVLKKMAERNKKSLPADEVMLETLRKLHLQNENNDEEKSNSTCITNLYSFWMKCTALIRIRSLRVTALAAFFCWFSASLVYYGVSLNSTNLSTNTYVYTFLGGLLEFPAYVALAPLIDRFGRTKILVLTYLVCAVSLFVVMVLILTDSDDITSVMLVISLTGKFAITAAFQLIWMFTAELFPTEYRSIALGESSVCARLGSGVSPFINDLLGDTENNKWAPSALFAGLSLIAGGISAILPDTNKKLLTDSVKTLKTDSVMELTGVVENKPTI